MSSMLYAGSQEEANSIRNISEIWCAHSNALWKHQFYKHLQESSGAHSDTLWQHQCYKHIQEYNDAFQDKTYSYKVSLFMGTCHREEHQVGIHWYKEIDWIYFHQAS